jgi:DNA-binding MarR family transcriptional regulator
MTTDAPDQAVRVLKQFRVIFRAVKEHYRKVEQLTGLSGSHVWALVIIDENPGIRPGALNDRLAIHQSTASNIVRHLVAQGYVLRSRSPSDARAYELVGTTKGKELLSHVPEPKMGLLVNALTEMPTASVASLEGLLDHLIARMGQPAAGQGSAFEPLID